MLRAAPSGAMRAVLAVLVLLLAPSALASPAFEEREGVLSLSCPRTLQAGAFGWYTPSFTCHASAVHDVAASEGAYVVELAWAAPARPTTVMACLSASERVASVEGNAVWRSIANACGESQDGTLTLRLPASARDDRVSVSAQLEPGERNGIGLYGGRSLDLAYVLRHEP